MMCHILIGILLGLTSVVHSQNSNLNCFTKSDCYGTSFCESNKIVQNKIKPENLSKMTCFHSKADSGLLNFTMGTNNPIFKSDGESPSRQVLLNSFCIDQTEVSNIQFFQFVQETKYQTEVK
jgi:hypothetical protein